MGLSIYKSDIDTISDNINIINYKQKNIENVINTINNSVNTLKANCYGTTVSVMCFKLNNLKQQIESVNEYLTKYKQESQQVVDLYYQHCDGLNLDEDTLRNNINILNNKIDIYNDLSKPNKRLVNNVTLQLERNQELLDGLYYVNNNTNSMLISDTQEEGTTNDDPWYLWNSVFKPIFDTIVDGKLTLYDYLDDSSKLFGNISKFFGWVSFYLNVLGKLEEDLNNAEFDIRWLLKTVNHVEVQKSAFALLVIVPAAFFPEIPVLSFFGSLAYGFINTDYNFLGGKSIIDIVEEGNDWLIDNTIDGVEYAWDKVCEGVDWLGKKFAGIGIPLW